MDTAKRDLISRVVPRSTVGELLSFRYIPTNQTFAMRARVLPRRQDSATTGAQLRHDLVSEVFIPAHVSAYDADQLVLRGCKLLGVTTHPDGNRVIRILPPAPGSTGMESVYSVQLGDRHDWLLRSLLMEEKETARADQRSASLEVETMLKLSRQAIRYMFGAG